MMSVALWLEKVREWDVAGFYLINGSFRNRAFDVLMPFITDMWKFILPLSLLFLYVLIFRPNRDRILVVSALAVFLLADAMTPFVKSLFQRIRPCHVLQQVYLAKGETCTGSFSLPSTHASNMFAIASVFSYNSKWLAIPCFVVAALVGYSRIYVGAHYPTDVLAGVVWGMLVGFPAAIAADRLTRIGHHNDLCQKVEGKDRPVSHTRPSQPHEPPG